VGASGDCPARAVGLGVEAELGGSSVEHSVEGGAEAVVGGAGEGALAAQEREEGRVDGGVRRAARAASLEGEVTAHRLRHTLATQALNRGMSLVLLASLHPRRLKAPAGTSSAPPTHCTAGRI